VHLVEDVLAKVIGNNIKAVLAGAQLSEEVLHASRETAHNARTHTRQPRDRVRRDVPVWPRVARARRARACTADTASRRRPDTATAHEHHLSVRTRECDCRAHLVVRVHAQKVHRWQLDRRRACRALVRLKQH
jgi:hypothetical protein